MRVTDRGKEFPRVVWAGGFRPGDLVVVRRYTTRRAGGCRAARVAYFPLPLWRIEETRNGLGLVPVIYGAIDRSDEVELEMVPADDLTFLPSD